MGRGTSRAYCHVMIPTGPLRSGSRVNRTLPVYRNYEERDISEDAFVRNLRVAEIFSLPKTRSPIESDTRWVAEDVAEFSGRLAQIEPINFERERGLH